MSASSRLVDVACLVANLLDKLADPACEITVERTYAPPWLDPELWKDNPDKATRFTGRRVYVFGATQRQVGPADRGFDINEYGIAVIVLELYTGDEAEVPDEWVDERLAWVEQEVYDRLGDARGEYLAENTWPESQEWTSAYNPELIRASKLFRSEVTVQVRRIDQG